MLSPEQRAALAEFIAQSKAESERGLAFWKKRMAAITNSEKHPDDIQKQTKAIKQCLKYGETEKQVFELAESALTNEPVLAEQVRKLREALTNLHHSASPPSYMDNDYVGVGQKTPMEHYEEAQQQAADALALPLPEAARQAAENAERAGRVTTLEDALRNALWMLVAFTPNEVQATHYHQILEQGRSALRAAKEAGNG